MFTLHPVITHDTVEITRLALCRVLLMDDRSWPWLILVPAQPDLRELYELEPADRATLMEEIAQVSTALRDLYQPHKINVAALGNNVDQLHVHVIARFRHDPAWPRPVWGMLPRELYEPHERDTLVRALRDALTRGGAE